MSRPDLEDAPAATEVLARFAADLGFADLPSVVVAHTRLATLDAIGCCLHGSTLPWSRILVDMILAEGARREASIWGTGERTSASLAVLANATAGHGFELDDLHTAGLIHASTLSVPVALALAEARGGATGAELVGAIVAGFEVGLRVGMAGTHSLFHRGFHPQGTTGALSAAASAARLLRLSPEQTQHALAIGASQAAGLMAAQEGAMTKRFHSGRAAQSGIYGALLAERGFTGIENAIEAPFGGFLSSYTDQADPALLTVGLGETWETLAIGFKPNPTVSCVQAPIEALATLMREHALEAADIQRVAVGCSTFTHKHSVWPYAGASVTEAQMSMAYALAVTAIDGAAFVAQYREDRIADPAILEFTGRVEANIEPEIDAMGPELRDAVRMTLRTRDGRTFTRELLYRPGSPEDPMTAEEIRNKFVKLCRESRLADRAEEIAATVDDLERLEDARQLVRLLAVG